MKQKVKKEIQNKKIHGIRKYHKSVGKDKLFYKKKTFENPTIGIPQYIRRIRRSNVKIYNYKVITS